MSPSRRSPWIPTPPPATTLAQRAQRLLLLTAARLPRRLASAIAPEPVPREETPLARAALGLAAVSSRTGLRMVIDDSADASRRALLAGSGALRGARLPVRARQTTFDGPRGPVSIRHFRPREPSGALLVFAHGGGWAIGDLDTYDHACRFLAHHSGAAVLAVDYGLAPEHPFPSGVDDLVAAFRWAVENADDLDIDPTRVALGGDSAGATLSAVASTELLGDPIRPAFQMLLFPATDLAGRTPSRDRFGAGLLLTEPDIEWFYRAYTGRADPAQPRVSPLRGEPDPALPPTYLATAGYDPLRDEGDAYALKLAQAGVPVVHDRRRDMVHGYLVFASLGGGFRRASLAAARALRQGLAAGDRS